jgi:hypothetical protein
LNNYLGQVPVAYNNDSFNAKIDYNLTSNQRLSGIYTHGSEVSRDLTGKSAPPRRNRLCLCPTPARVW